MSPYESFFTFACYLCSNHFSQKLFQETSACVFYCVFVVWFCQGQRSYKDRLGTPSSSGKSPQSSPRVHWHSSLALGELRMANPGDPKRMLCWRTIWMAHGGTRLGHARTRCATQIVAEVDTLQFGSCSTAAFYHVRLGPVVAMGCNG